jgi:hypothetical protein
MNDERFLKDWLQYTTDSTVDPNAAADKVVARLSSIPQRHRWLPWPSVRRAETDDIPATRRNRFMPSPVQTLAALALAVVAGGTLLLVTPDKAPADPAPAAGSDPVEAVPLLIDLEFLEQPFVGEKTTLANGSTRTEGVVLVSGVMEASDPRFEGTATITQTVDLHDGVELVIGGWRIENEGGAWQGTPFYGMDRASNAVAPGTTEEFVLVGEDGYEGFVAIVRGTVRPEADDSSGIIIDAPGAPRYRMEGFILNTADLPEAPRSWSPSEVGLAAD